MDEDCVFPTTCGAICDGRSAVSEASELGKRAQAGLKAAKTYSSELLAAYTTDHFHVFPNYVQTIFGRLETGDKTPFR
jgi:hypothetical protein